MTPVVSNEMAWVALSDVTVRRMSSAPRATAMVLPVAVFSASAKCVQSVVLV